MIRFNELLERAKSEAIAVHTSIESQATTLLSELNKKGYKWLGGRKLTIETLYEYYKENSCYCFGIDILLLSKKVMYGPLSFYEEYYTIVEFQDINFKEE